MSEKKGDLLNQMAIISDLLEKTNLTSKRITTFFELEEDEFNKTQDYLNKKNNEGNIEDDGSGTFSLLIGDIQFMFSKNSV